MDRVLAETLLDVVSEVGQESHAIIKLNSEGLIIDCAPCSVYTSSLALALAGALTRLSFVAIKQLNTPDILLFELKIMIFSDNLDVIWSPVGANLIGLEQINSAHFL